jgi:hypothetical protein
VPLIWLLLDRNYQHADAQWVPCHNSKGALKCCLRFNSQNTVPILQTAQG